MFDQNSLEAMLACFGMFRFGPTWEEAFACLKNVLEAMLSHIYVLKAMLVCFGMFRFGPTWEEALCMFDKCAGSDAGTFTF